VKVVPVGHSLKGFVHVAMTFRAKKSRRRVATRYDGCSDVDPEIFVKTMTVIKSLKPSEDGEASLQKNVTASAGRALEEQRNVVVSDGQKLTKGRFFHRNFIFH